MNILLTFAQGAYLGLGFSSSNLAFSNSSFFDFMISSKSFCIFLKSSVAFSNAFIFFCFSSSIPSKSRGSFPKNLLTSSEVSAVGLSQLCFLISFRRVNFDLSTNLASSNLRTLAKSLHSWLEAFINNPSSSTCFSSKSAISSCISSCFLAA